MGNANSVMGNGMSPLQSPNHMMTPMYGYHNGSPLHSPMDSPHASTLMLEGTGTPCMELSPPGMHDFNPDAGSLPNLQNHTQMQQQQEYTNGCNGMGGGGGGGGYYHAPVGPRHSTGTCGPRLVPGPALTPESQSAPTSPHNQLDPNQPPMWPTRTFSNSPEALDIPKLTITNAEGAPGHHVDCYNDVSYFSPDLYPTDLFSGPRARHTGKRDVQRGRCSTDAAEHIVPRPGRCADAAELVALAVIPAHCDPSSPSLLVHFISHLVSVSLSSSQPSSPRRPLKETTLTDICMFLTTLLLLSLLFPINFDYVFFECTL